MLVLPLLPEEAPSHAMSRMNSLGHSFVTQTDVSLRQVTCMLVLMQFHHGTFVQ